MIVDPAAACGAGKEATTFRRGRATADADEIRHVTLRAGERRTVEIMSRPEAGPTPKPDKR